MKFIIAPDSFKGSISAAQAACCIARGLQQIFPDAHCILLPVADGGEGTVDAFHAAVPAMKLVTRQVDGPLGRPVSGVYGILPNNTAVIEIASASGITLVTEAEQKPFEATTCGTGQLICHALDQGCNPIILGLGGSATNDGGLGIFRALGGRVLAADGTEITVPAQLNQIKSIDSNGLHPKLKEVSIILATDVTNLLCGDTGATAIFGPQKGVKPQEIAVLDSCLYTFAQQLNPSLLQVPGLGAAGGAGLPLFAFGTAELRRGIDVVLDCIGIEKHLSEADLVITGEGKMDGQSIYGKVPIGVAKRAKQHHLPVVAMVGSMGSGAEQAYLHGIDAIVPITPSPLSLEEAMKNGPQLLEEAANRFARTLQVGIQLK